MVLLLFCSWKFILEFSFAQFSGILKHFVVFTELFCRFINSFYSYVGVNSCGVSKLFLVF